MNYRHLYHAGNFADVFKHVLLIKLLEKLCIKDTPFCVLDTHAGIGLYDLRSDNALKTGEFKEGIHRVLDAHPLPETLKPYLDIVQSFNANSFHYYPGSPCIARSLLRPQDRLTLAELHPDDAHTLKRHFSRDKQVTAHQMDAYLSMKAFLPPKEKRGLVLIDPPFEKTDEFERITEALQMACQRFQQGIYAIWYPIKDRLPVRYFHHSLLATHIPKILAIELLIRTDNAADSLNGCGMIVVNPPWKLEQEAKEWLPELLRILQPDGQGSISVEWLRE